MRLILHLTTSRKRRQSGSRTRYVACPTQMRGELGPEMSMTETRLARPGEIAIDLPQAFDAGVHFIGRVRTPFKTRDDCPKNTAQSDAVGRVEVDPRYAAGLMDLRLYSHAILLYWMDQARRDLVVQVPAHLGHPRGTFALR